MVDVLCFDDRVAQSIKPLFHDLGDAVADRTRPAVKLRSHRGKETTAAKDALLHVRQPDVAQIPETWQALRRVESGLDDFVNEDRAGGFNRGHLQLFFRAEVREKTAFAHGKVGSEAADGQAFEAFGRGDVDGRFENCPAGAITLRFTTFEFELSHDVGVYSTNVRFTPSRIFTTAGARPSSGLVLSFSS